MAMKREIKTIFSLDGETKYKDAIKSINKEQSLLRAQSNAAGQAFDLLKDKQGKLSSQSESLSKQIEQQKQKIKEAQNAVEQSNKVYGEADDRTKEYKIQLANAEAGLSKLKSALESTNKELVLQSSGLKKAGDTAESVGRKMKSVGDNMSKVGDKMTTGLTLPILAAAAYSVKAATDFESAFAGVEKTVDATEKELSDLSEGIRDMAKEVPASAVEISAVAEAAGQLGIKTENILAFSKAMIDMGESTNLSADEAATSLAQFANIMQMDQENFDRLGSAIVALGNDGASTEADITAMALRLAGAAKQVGMTESDILGIASALASVGIEAEAGGSAFSKVMVDMQLAVLKGGQGLSDYANVAGMTASEFATAYKKDAAGALTAFVTGLGQMKAKGGDAILTLDNMGIVEVRMRDALLRASGAGDLLTKSIELGSKAWSENTALATEAEKRYSTNASKFKMAKNELTDAAIVIGQNLLPPLADLAKSVSGLAESFGELSPEMQRTILIALGVAAAVGPVVKVVGTLSSGLGAASTAVGKYIKKMAEKKAAEAAATIATEGVTSAVSGGGGLIASLGPAGLIIGATALVVGGLALACYEADKGMREAGKAGEQLAQDAANWHNGVDSATSALANFNQETIITAEKMTQLESGIDTAQKNIVKIAERAAAESRAYTTAERKEIESLVGMIADYTQMKVDAYQKQAEVVAAMATKERDVTLTRANELIKGAEDTKNQTLAISQALYTDTVAEAEKLYGHLGVLDKGRYDAMVANGQKEYDQQKSAADKTYGDTLAIIQQKYLDYDDESKEYLRKIAADNETLEALEAGKNARLAEKVEERKKQLHVESLDRVEAAKVEYYNELWYASEKNRLVTEIGTYYKKINEDSMGSWLGMVANTQLYGGQLNAETQMIADGIVGSFEYLPDKSKKAMEDAMDGMLEGMEEKEPSLFEKAANIAGSILKTIREVFDEHSPSKKMEEIAKQLFAGAEKPMDEAAIKLPRKTGEIADKMLSEAARMAEAQDYLNSRMASSGLSYQLASPMKTVVETAGGVTNTTTVRHTHEGLITVKGINSKDEAIAVYDIVLERIQQEYKLSGK